MKAGWPRRRLGDVCEVVNGGTPKTRVSEFWGGAHLWITPAEMGKRISPYVGDTERKLTDLGLRDSSARMLPPCSVIISSRAPIGHLVINTRPMATNQGCKGLVPGKEIHRKFLYYYLSSIVDLLNSMGTGATFKEISGSKLKEVPVPIAPLLEQRRIVGILDEAFDGIATAKANVERNIQNAHGLFEAHLQDGLTARGSSHVERRLEDICEQITVGYVGPMTKQYRDRGIPFLRSQNIRPFRVVFDGLVFIDEAFDQNLAKSRLRPGDVAIVRTGYPGTAAVIPASLPASNCSDLVIVRPNASVDPHYLSMFFNSAYGKRLVAGRLVGAAQKHFNVTAAKNVVLALPSLHEQRRLSARLQALAAETRRLESVYQRKLAALDELKQSLLHQAFTGQL